MSEFQFKPAVREAAKVLIGLCGSSGSGKTLSALKLATGLGGPIAFVDTEQGRALQYADDFKFLHAVLPPPFSPERYATIIESAVRTKPNVIIIDSFSHEWEGMGGILETVEAAKTGGNEFGLWAKPKAAHRKLMNRLLQVPAHIIICMRAKEKKGLALDPHKPGKKVVVSLGWHPICESEMTFELTINCLMSSEKKGTPIVDGFDFGKLPYNMAHLLPTNQQISERTGEAIAKWCREGGTPTLTSKRLDDLETNSAAPLPPAADAEPAAVSRGAQQPAGTSSPEKTSTHKYPLVNTITGRTDWYASLRDWGGALEALVTMARDPTEAWDANQTTWVTLDRNARTDEQRGYLKALQDHALAAAKGDRELELARGA